MTVTFDLTEDDLVRFAEHYSATSPVMRRQKRWLEIVPALGLFAGFTYAYRSTQLRALFLGVVTAAIYVLLVRMAGPSMLRGTLRRSFREGSTVSVLGTHALTIDELGLAAKSSHGEGRISWAAVSRVEDTAHYVYIHTFPGSGVVVPKRAFGNDAEASAFLANVLALKKGGV